MTVVTRLLTRISFCVLMLGMLSITPGHSVAARADSIHVASSNTYYYPEVRLRKLHLVRPDLIPYPIYYEIYC